MAPYPKIKVRLSPNYSSRQGRKVKGAVVHTTESDDGSINGIVNFFQKAGSPSSHYVIDTEVVDRKNGFTEVVRVVPETYKAWTALTANPYFVQYELVGRARRTRAEWLGKYRYQLNTLAALVAEDSIQYDFPIAHSYPGVVGHVDLPKYGFPQTHWDPGPNFPWAVFLGMVRDAATARRKPVVKDVPGKLEGRPKGTPVVIPRWAWDLREWWYKGRVGPRPANAPGRNELPDWFWPWFRWKAGIGAAHGPA